MKGFVKKRRSLKKQTNMRVSNKRGGENNKPTLASVDERKTYNTD